MYLASVASTSIPCCTYPPSRPLSWFSSISNISALWLSIPAGESWRTTLGVSATDAKPVSRDRSFAFCNCQDDTRWWKCLDCDLSDSSRIQIFAECRSRLSFETFPRLSCSDRVGTSARVGCFGWICGESFAIKLEIQENFMTRTIELCASPTRFRERMFAAGLRHSSDYNWRWASCRNRCSTSSW